MGIGEDILGVTYEKSRNKYRATTQVNGKTKHIGRFDTKLKATRALNKFRKDLADEKLVQDSFEAEFGKIKEDQDLQLPYQPAFDIDEPIIEQKPSRWDRIKGIWRNTKPQN